MLVAQCNNMGTRNDRGSFIRHHIPSKAGNIALTTSGMFALSILLAASRMLAGGTRLARNPAQWSGTFQSVLEATLGKFAMLKH
jgi:hypothetical protein